MQNHTLWPPKFFFLFPFFFPSLSLTSQRWAAFLLLVGKESSSSVRHVSAFPLTSAQKLFLLLLYVPHPSASQTSEHEIIFNSVIPMLRSRSQEVKARGDAWGSGFRYRDSDLCFVKLPFCWFSHRGRELNICTHWGSDIFQMIHKKAGWLLLLPWKIRPSGCPHDTF